jgi:hypothetical protein
LNCEALKLLTLRGWCARRLKIFMGKTSEFRH